MGDGCNMEGISNEAASLAGHWGLGRLIAFYDDNRISIDGCTDISFTEDVSARYVALGWHVQHVVVSSPPIAGSSLPGRVPAERPVHWLPLAFLTPSLCDSDWPGNKDNRALQESPSHFTNADPAAELQSVCCATVPCEPHSQSRPLQHSRLELSSGSLLPVWRQNFWVGALDPALTRRFNNHDLIATRCLPPGPR